MRDLQKSFGDFIFTTGAFLLSLPLSIASESIQGRLLGPEMYGKLGIALSVISLFFLITISWTNTAIVRFGKEEFTLNGNIRKTFSNFLFLNIVLVGVGICVFMVTYQYIFDFLGINIKYSKILILIGFVSTTFKTFLLQILKTIRLIKLQSLLERVLKKVFILFAVLLIYFVTNKLDLTYLILGYVLSDVFIIIIGFYFTKKQLLFPFIFDKKFFFKVLIFSLPLFFSTGANFLVNYVDQYTIKFYMDDTSVGLYNAAYKIFMLVKSFIGLNITTILMPIILVYKSKNQEYKLIRFVKRIVPQISFLGFGMVFILIVTADIFMPLIYGIEYAGSILPFQILIASQNFGIISAALTGLFFAYDKTRMLAILGISAGVINLIGDVVLVKTIGIAGAAIVSLVVFSIPPLIWLFYFHNKFKIKRYLSLLFPLGIIIILGINMIEIPYFLKLLASIVSFILVFYFARRHNLFNTSDIEILDNVNIPPKIRNFIYKLIHVLSKQ